MQSNMLMFGPDLYKRLQSQDPGIVSMAHNFWEENLENYERWISVHAPPLVNEFYQKTQYLHDSVVLKIETRRGHAELEFLREFGDKPKIRIQFEYDSFQEMLYQDFLTSREGNPEYLYDEFQLIDTPLKPEYSYERTKKVFYNQKEIRYVFYTSVGREYTFDNVRNFRYEEPDQDPEVSQIPQGPA